MGARAIDLFLAHSEEQNLLRDSCRAVFERELSTDWVRSHLESPSGWDRSRWKVIRELGWPALAIAEAHGGVGLGLVELGVLAEEAGRAVDPSPLLSTAVAGLVLSASDDAEQLGQWLPRLAEGDAIAAWSVDAEGRARDVVADRTADGRQLVLRGRRAFVACAADADLLLIDVSFDDARRLVLVPADTPGLQLRRMTTVDLSRAYFELEFDEVKLDVEAAVVGDDRDRTRRFLLDAGTAIQCAESVGSARRLLEMTVEYVQQRHQFDRPIGSFQAIKHRMADMRIRLESSMVATRYALWAVAEERADATRAVHVAKLHAGESCSWVASEALQVHGGIAFTWEHDLHLHLRRLKANELTLGGPDWHALELGRWRLENAVD